MACDQWIGVTAAITHWLERFFVLKRQRADRYRSKIDLLAPDLGDVELL